MYVGAEWCGLKDQGLVNLMYQYRDQLLFLLEDYQMLHLGRRDLGLEREHSHFSP